MGSGKWGVGNGEWEMGSGELPHERLEAWKQGMGLVKAIYEISKGFPREEMFGLTRQIRRAAVSIPSNLAEGAARDGSKEYTHFISIARGSLSELRTQGQTAQMPGYINDPPQPTQTMNHVGRLLTGLHKKWSNP
jgi:four helix bundle protein